MGKMTWMVFIFQADRLIKALKQHFEQQKSTENVSQLTSLISHLKWPAVHLFREEEVTGISNGSPLDVQHTTQDVESVYFVVFN